MMAGYWVPYAAALVPAPVMQFNHTSKNFTLMGQTKIVRPLSIYKASMAVLQNRCFGPCGFAGDNKGFQFHTGR